MNKPKIHELAKELNVTSKRLMEKLDEIGIHPKSHMTTLEDGELEKLYKHIGVVKRVKNDAGAAHGDAESKSDHVDNAARKSAPRIIRKTEVIIRDETPLQEPKDKKEKKSFVRSSDSNDGLMAGFTRGRDNLISNVKKHPRHEAEEQKEEIKPILKSEAERPVDRQQKPVDDILSIKKVSHKTEKIESTTEGSDVKEQENMQKESIVLEKPQIQPTEQVEKVVKTPVKPEASEKTEPEKSDPIPVAEPVQKVEKKPEPVEEAKPAATVKNDRPERPRETNRPPHDNNNRPREGTGGGYQGQQRQGEFKPREGGQRDSQGGYQGQRQGEFRPRDGGQGGYQGQRQGEFRPRDGGQGGYQGQRQGEFRPRDGGQSGYQGQRQGEFRPRDGGQGGYQGQRQGEFRPRDGGQGGYQGQRQGDFRPREGGNQGGYQGQRQGEYRPREGGYQGGQREGGYQGQRQGDYRPREGGYQGGQREGGYQGGQREGGYQGGNRPPREGGYQGRQGDRSYGGRPPYDKDAKPGEFRRDDNRGPGGGRNRPLTIPKAAAPAGATEEKVFTRGERRTFQTVEKQKEEKKEQKKDTTRSAPGGADKGTNIRKKIDTVVGHKANVSDMMSDDFVIDVFYNDADEAINAKRAEKRIRKSKQKEKYIPPKAVLTDITVGEDVTVKELAEALKKTSAEIIKRLFLMGVTATQNQELDFDTAYIIGEEIGVKVHKAVVVSKEDILFDDSDDGEENLVPRAPVVVVMGHVDHGKTSLLDAIRSADIAENEAGGITQHIGAYTVNLHGRDITFLDTPGHEAFTAMRARGAQVTDIAILVVAADDGVMPQTVEAINHAKAAGVSIIVAINKIDKPGANPDRVKQELTEHGLLIEEWGGDIIAVPVSAKKHENIDQLLEMVLLTADILELKANPDKQAKGTVIEAQLDKNKGPVATLLVQRGTLKVGDAILSGSTFGHIRSMINDKGRKIKEAGPSVPVEIFGLSEVPEAGDVFYAVTDERVAKQLAEKRKEQTHEKQIGRVKVSLDDLFSQIQQGTVKDLNLIIKADVQGSVEAIRQSMEKLSNDEVKVKIIHGAVGSIIEADVTLAEVSNAIIIGFNVRPSAKVVEMAKAAGVDMRLYRIIYDAIEDIQKAMKGMLDPTFKEVVNGHAEIRQIFKVSNVGTIGGSYVTDGKILRNSEIRIVRDGIVILEGKLASLKRFKDDAKEVAAGYECGIMIERYNDIKEGDIIESFHMEEVERQ